MTKYLCFVFVALAAGHAAPPSHVALGNLPVAFEANSGQAPREYSYVARGAGYGMALRATGAVFDYGATPVFFRLHGANEGAAATALDQLPGVSNYLHGNDRSRWRTGIAQYRKVRFSGVYQGIDLIYYGNPSLLEYDFVVEPGADPRVVEFDFPGSKVRLDGDGALVVETAGGEIRQAVPLAYQELDGKRRRVDAGYRLTGGGKVGFVVGEFDASRALVIDPVVQFATFYGGRLRESAHAVAVAPDGNLFVVGLATSDDFPASPGAVQTRVNGNNDIYVAKINSTGTAVLFSTLVGGSDDELDPAVAVDRNGMVVVSGTTRSVNFPTTPGTVRERSNGPAGDTDGFVFKLNPTGVLFQFSTRVGGTGLDRAFGVSVDPSDNIVVVGETASQDLLITEGAYREELLGPNDAFVIKMTGNGSRILFSTFLGGDTDTFVIGVDSARAVTTDRNGGIYITGITTMRDFPVTAGAYQREHLGQSDVFVTRMLADGSGIVWSTFLGGEGLDTPKAIALDVNFNVYVVGSTTSLRFPTTPSVIQTAAVAGIAGANEAFVTKLNNNGTPVFSTFLGGNADDVANGVAPDTSGNAWVIGTTSSTNFPVSFNAFQFNAAHSTPGSRFDAFLVQLSPVGNQLIFGSYLGGPQNEEGNAIARDPAGNVYLAGFTSSSGFPLTPGALQRNSGAGTSTSFIARVGESQSVPTKLTLVSGGVQSADENAPLREPLVFRLTDAFNNPVVATTVQFTAVNATLAVNSAATDGRGEVSVRVVAGSRRGPASVTATVNPQVTAELAFVVNRVGPPLPQINTDGIVGAALGNPPVRHLAAGGLYTVFGSNFGPEQSFAQVGSGDLVDGKAPTSFAGVCVVVDGVAARILLVTFGQINFQVPEIARTGQVNVVVIRNCGQVGQLESDPVSIELRGASPEFFSFQQTADGVNPVAAVKTLTGELVGPSSVAPALVAALPNDLISVFGHGFGGTTPPFASGEAAPGAASTVVTPVVTFDGKDLPADHVLYSGLTPGLIGVYQINMRVPAGTRNGRLSLSAAFGAESTPPGTYLLVAGGLNLQPRISVSPARLDLSEVVLGMPQTRNVTLTNSGDFTLTIQAIATSSAEVAPSTRIGFVLEPGQSRSIEIAFTGRTLGPFSAQISIASSDPDQPVTVIPFSAVVVSQPPAANPAPRILSLSPNMVEAGSAGFTLVVNGEGFVRTSTVEINNQSRPTFFNHSGQLIANISALDIVDPGVRVITVVNPMPGGGRSPQAVMTITPSTIPISGARAIINELDVRFCPVIDSYVSVLDATGAPVQGLTQERLTCAEDLDPVECSIAPAVAVQPLSLTLVYGTNGTKSDEERILLNSATRAMLTLLPSDDRIQLYHLETEARLQVGFTTDRDLIYNRLPLLVPSGDGNALYDAVVRTAQSNRNQTDRRHAVVLITALDNRSGLLQEFSQTLGVARSAGVPFFTVAIGDGASDAGLAGTLRQLSRETGGEFIAENNPRNFAQVLPLIARKLNAQYLVRHTSRFPTGQKTIKYTFQTVDGNVTATRSYTPCLPR